MTPSSPPPGDGGSDDDRSAEISAEPEAPAVAVDEPRQTAEQSSHDAADAIEPASTDEPASTEADGAEPGDDEGSGGDAAAGDPGQAEPTLPNDPAPSMLGAAGETRSWLLELPDFEGPLDLLLHLVRRHELDILDIPISFVTEKYLEYLAFMQALDLEVAGDYLVMAATLAYLKSRELVPHRSHGGGATRRHLDEDGPGPPRRADRPVARVPKVQACRGVGPRFASRFQGQGRLRAGVGGSNSLRWIPG